MNVLKYILATLALMIGAVLVPTLANADDSGEPCVETADRTETAWFETDPGPPWEPTGASREKTAAGADTVETSGWLTAPPAGEGWQQTAQRTVDGALISPAVDRWWHWNGPSDPTAAPPAAGWGPDSGDHNGIPAPTNTIHNESHGPNGNASWFYHQVTAAVYEQVTEYMYRRTIPGTPAVMEHEYSRFIEGTDCPADEEPVEECPEGQVGTPPNCEDDEDPEEPVEECPEGQVGTPPNCEDDEDPELPVEECPEGQVGTPPNCEDDDDDGKPQPPVGNPGGFTGTPPTVTTGNPSTGGLGGLGSTGPTSIAPTRDTPMIEKPGPDEEIVFQSFDSQGNLVEQRVSGPIPGVAQQEGM